MTKCSSVILLFMHIIYIYIVQKQKGNEVKTQTLNAIPNNNNNEL